MATIFFEDIEGEVECFNVDQDFNKKLESFYLKWNDKIKNELDLCNYKILNENGLQLSPHEFGIPQKIYVINLNKSLKIDLYFIW